ncbi:MAG: hypothetical protein ACUVXH_08900 [Anaerolineae bacterium]
MTGGSQVHPLTPDRWDDLERPFGQRGACGGCWCMGWRLFHGEFEAQKGEGNCRALQAIVQSDEVLGILACRESQSVGWCAVAPRVGMGCVAFVASPTSNLYAAREAVER